MLVSHDYRQQIPGQGTWVLGLIAHCSITLSSQVWTGALQALNGCAVVAQVNRHPAAGCCSTTAIEQFRYKLITAFRCLSCRFKDEQVFEDIIETQIKAVTLIEGEWYVRLDGDLAGKVVGAVYDASAGDTDLVPISLSVSHCWAVGGCELHDGTQHSTVPLAGSAQADVLQRTM